VKRGGLIAFPTDTVYGLGCDPRNPQALSKLFSVKGKRVKPIPILVSSLRLAQRIAVMDEKARTLASTFWPGPLTIVVRLKVHFPRLLTKGRRTIALRCPRNETTLQLVRKCGGLLTGTSANMTGQPPCISSAMVRRRLGDGIDAVVDGGRAPRRIGSTIVRTHSRGITMLRKGPIRDAEIRRALSSATSTVNKPS